MEFKIIIIGPQNVDKYKLARVLENINDDLNICPTFNTLIDRKNTVTDDFVYYMNNADVELGYINNAFLYVTTYKEFNKGIERTNIYSKDIFVLDFIDFNNISERTLDELQRKLFIWLDTKEKSSKEDIEESKYSFERSNKYDLMYFVDEDINSIAKTILRYISSDCTEEERQQILEENL